MFSGTLYNLFSAGPVAVEEPRSLVATALSLYWYTPSSMKNFSLPIQRLGKSNLQKATETIATKMPSRADCMKTWKMGSTYIQLIIRFKVMKIKSSIGRHIFALAISINSWYFFNSCTTSYNPK